MIKYFKNDPINSLGEATVVGIKTSYELVKTAGYENLNNDIQSYIRNLKSKEGKAYLLISALSDLNWGPNTNGDGWPEQGLSHKGKDYGYKTFELFGHYYHLHNNKDVNNSYGDVLFSTWNPQMHRVELVVEVDVNKDFKTRDALEHNKIIETSMGCFIEGSNVTLSDGSVRDIKDIKKGDRVISLKGSPTEVTEKHIREYSGKLYNIKAFAMPEINCTFEHPIYAVRKESLIGREKPSFEKAEWVHAKCLSEGDYLLSAIPQETRTPDYVTRDLARLLGYYLAEGHIIYSKKRKPVAVGFACNKDDALLEELPGIAERLNLYNAPVVRERNYSEKVRIVTLNDKRIAKICYELCGSYAKGKRLDEEMMYWGVEYQKEFLGAYIDGDGSCSKGKWQPGSVTISTASTHLSKQIPLMLTRLGIVPSVNLIQHKPSKIVKIATTEHSVFIGKTYTHILRDYSRKIKDNYVEPKNSHYSRHVDDRFYYSKIKEITTKEVENIPVYNFEVDCSSESYLVEGAVVHNCKVNYDICHVCHPKWEEFYKIPEDDMVKLSRAMTLKEVYAIGKKHNVDLSYIKELNDEGFIANKDGEKVSTGRGPVGIHTGPDKNCYHMKYYKNKILPTGEKVYVINLRPRFFDISFVRVNSEKSSFVLAKVANDMNTIERMDDEDFDNMVKNAGVKTSSITKKIQGDVLTDDLEKMQEYYKEVIIPKLKATEEELPKDKLDDMALKYPMEKILSTFLSMGMFPRPREFQRIMLVNRGHRRMADDFDRRGIHITERDVHRCTRGVNLDGLVDKIHYGGDNIEDGIIEMLMPYLHKKSYHRPSVVKRIILIKEAEGKLNSYIPETPKRNSPLPGILATIAAYMGIAKISGNKAMLKTLKDLAEKKYAVAGAVLGAEAASEILNQNRAYANAIRENVKTASVGTAAATIVGIPLASYMYSEHAINKARNGIPLTGTETIIAKHPLAVGVGGALMANKGSRTAIVKAISKLMKVGSDMSEAGIGFEGLNINEFPPEQRDGIIAGLWEAMDEYRGR